MAKPPNVKPTIIDLPIYRTADSNLLPHKVRNAIDLSSNENRFGTSPKVQHTIAKQLTYDYTSYPNSTGAPLKKALAFHHGMSEKSILLGNGSLQVIQTLIRGIIQPNDNVILSQYAYLPIFLMCQSEGANITTVKAKNYSHNLKAMLLSITNKTKLIVLVNPNNPTGTSFTKKELENFLDQVPTEILVLIDEAYHQYFLSHQGFDCLKLLKNYNNLFLVRTFSKAYGLAGLRVGYGMAHEHLIQMLQKIQLPFSLTSFSLMASQAALQDYSYVKNVVNLTKQSMMRFTNELNTIKIPYIPSTSNFICINLGIYSNEAYRYLCRNNIYVRQLDNYGLPDFLRVTIGYEIEMQSVCIKLKEFIHNNALEINGKSKV